MFVNILVWSKAAIFTHGDKKKKAKVQYLIYFAISYLM